MIFELHDAGDLILHVCPCVVFESVYRPQVWSMMMLLPAQHRWRQEHFDQTQTFVFRKFKNIYFKQSFTWWKPSNKIKIDITFITFYFFIIILKASLNVLFTEHKIEFYIWRGLKYDHNISKISISCQINSKHLYPRWQQNQELLEYYAGWYWWNNQEQIFS